MSSNEQTYLDLLARIMNEGSDRPDRTGVGVRSLFGVQTRYDLKSGFPMLTTRKLNFKTALSEMLWFIEGSGDERRLAELRYGKPRSELVGKTTIWSENLNAPYWRDKAKFEGDLGNIYGRMWRFWETPVRQPDGSVTIKTTDQLKNLIDGIKRDPFSRRHVLTAWNPGELENMALPPCHMTSTFYVSGGELSCHLLQRSADFAIGSCINITSYTLLTHMIAQVCGLKVGEFVYSISDAHVYHNLFDQVKEQLSRKPRIAPMLYMDPTVKNIDDFKMEDFELMGYDPLPAIKMPMAV